MKRISILIVLLCLLLTGTVVTAQRDPQSITPYDYLTQYINALNLRDYTRAYSMLQSPQQTYADYVAGYANTVRIIAYFGMVDGAAGSTYVTTILLGYQTDGTVESYYGYYQLTSGQNYTPPLNGGGWVLLGGRFALVKDGDALQNDSIATLLALPWQDNIILPVETATVSAMNNDFSKALHAYYDLINSRNYTAAYAEWLIPGAGGPAVDYRPAYTRFAAGYSDTLHVTLYAGDVQPIPAAQQRSYLVGYVPALLVGEHLDGTFVSYRGCYAVGVLPDGTLGIVNGRFRLLQAGVPEALAIMSGVSSLNCATLGMGI